MSTTRPAPFGRLTLAALLVVAGCRSTEPQPPRPIRGQTSYTLVMSASSEAEFWDRDPAPDGVKATVFLYASQSRNPVTAEGSFRFALLPGRVSAKRAAKDRSIRPLHVWSFGPEDSKGHLRNTVIGWSYAFKLDWGAQAPPAGPATLSAQFVPAAGRRKSPPTARQYLQVPGPASR